MGRHGENLKLHVQSLGRKRSACVPQWRSMRCLPAVLSLLALLTPALAQKRLVLIDQDGSGPGGSNQMAMMVLLQSPQVEVLGITMVTGNAWRDEEMQHTLRMLELIGRTDVPVVPGAVFPLVRTEEETRLAALLFGKVAWLGAWRQVSPHGPWEVPPLSEGAPRIKPLEEDAAHDLHEDLLSDGANS